MSRYIRNFSTFNRALRRPAFSSLPYDGSINVRRVRFVRPVMLFRRAQPLFIWGIGGVIAANFLYDAIVEEGGQEEHDEAEVVRKEPHGTQLGIREAPTDKTKSEQGEGIKEEEEGEIREEEGKSRDEVDDDDVVPAEQPEDAWFLPLWFARKQPRYLYKGNDPEWQSFLEFSKDKQRNLLVRHQLAHTVGESFNKRAAFQKILGNPIQTGNYWLDVDFPKGPPPDYERLGIEITDDYIAFLARPVDPLRRSRLQNALSPMPMVRSLWASHNQLWAFELARVKAYLNIKPNSRIESKAASKHVGFTRLPQMQDKEQRDSGTGMEQSQEGDGDRKRVYSRSTTADAAKVLSVVPSIPEPQGSVAAAMHAFRTTLAKNWKPLDIPLPRGCLLISGLVELHGAKGICTLDVHAAYNPVEKIFPVIKIRARRLQPRTQGPAGGP